MGESKQVHYNNPPLGSLLFLISISLLSSIINADNFEVRPSSSFSSDTTNYLFNIYADNGGFIPDANSNFVITFPSDYDNRLTSGARTCSLVWDFYAVAPAITCLVSGSNLIISNLFAANVDYTSVYFQITVNSILNPFRSGFTVSGYTFTATVAASNYVIISSPLNFITTTMTCSATTSPSIVNQPGVINLAFTPPYFPIGSTISVQFLIHWEQTQPKTSQNSIVQSMTVSCLPIANVQGLISCSLDNTGTSYLLTVSNLVNTNISNAAIKFSFGPIFTPPSVLPQGVFSLTAKNNDIQMSLCSGITVTGTTSGALSIPQFAPVTTTVNAVSMGILQFVTHSNVIVTDTIMVVFPIQFSITPLTSVYIINGNYHDNSPTVSGNTINISNTNAFQGDNFYITFTNIKNPVSELTSSIFQITTIRNGYTMETLTTSLTFSATRSSIITATLTSSNYQVGATADYSIQFTLTQIYTTASLIIILFPTSIQGKVGGCSSSGSCSVSSTQAAFNITTPSNGSLIQLTLLNVINSYTLGTTTSLTLYTLYHYSQPTSIVEYVNSGLTLSLVARVMPSANVAISSSSLVVGSYPSTYTITLTNTNPLPAFSYLVVYIPPEIIVISANQIICQAGAISLSCNYNTLNNMLTLSYFSTTNIAIGQLVNSPILILNLANPVSTRSTASFGIYFYNSANQIIQYLSSGLSYRVTQAASFYSLSLTPNNSVNSAPTLLLVSFNVPSTSYNNNTVVVLTFPIKISLQSATCTSLSSNIGSLSCSIIANKFQVQINYASLATSASTDFSVHTYNNFPSLEPYSIQIDLFQDFYLTSKLCSNANSLSLLQNIQAGVVTLQSFTFSTSTLISSTNLNIQISSSSSVTFSSLIVSFPQQFIITSTTCSLPSLTTCSLTAGNSVTIISSTTINIPFIFTINNIISPFFSPSSNIYLQTYSSTNYLMDSNTNIQFTTVCTLPCKTCTSAVLPTSCTSCYSNTTLVQGQIYLNGSICTSVCGFGLYLDNATSSCLVCSSICLTCSEYSVCLSCSNSTFLYNFTCMANCPYGYYGFNFQCLLCPPIIHCQSCPNNYQCSTCILGYYYYNLQCKLDCPSLITYQNSVNRTCDSCPINCTNCLGNSSSVICTLCNNGYVMDSNRCYFSCVTAGLIAVNGICSGCASICLTCSLTITNCTSCLSTSLNPYLYNYNCLGHCPSGYFQQNSTFSCQTCTTPCQYCLSSSVHSCLSCISGYFLHQSDCMVSCPSTFYNSSGLCVACVSPCLTCNQQLICLSCVNSTFLYNTQCVPSCPAGMVVINGNQCLVCPSVCKTCSSSIFCTSCFNTTYLYNGTCPSICPNGSYSNIINSTCDICTSPCSSCSNSTFCLSCLDSTKFLVNGGCVPCLSPCNSCSMTISNCTSCLSNTSTPYYFAFNCLSICPSTYFSNNITFQCSSCAYPCLQCSGSTNSSCSSCLNGYYFLLNTCYISCPSTYFQNLSVCSSCLSPCQTCSSSTICLSCENGTYLYGTNCQTSCGNGSTIINGNQCSLCSVSCKTCLSVNTSACTSCYPTTYLHVNICNYTCIDGYFPDSVSSTCIACLSPCLRCNSAIFCLSCLDSNLFLVNGTCLSCQSPCLTCSGLRNNCTSCNTTSLFPYLANFTCIASCPITYFGDSTYLCYKCLSPCQTCQNASSQFCSTCLPGYYQLASSCFLLCPSTYFANISLCSACISPCLTCIDSSSCLSCIPTKYLFGSSCVAACDPGMAIINGSICQYCSSSCKTCLSSNSSACTSCNPTSFLYGSQCLTSCPNSTYADNVSSICQNCIAPCLFCQSLTFCLSCIESNSFLVNGFCLGCLNPCVTCSISRSNCTSCSISTGFPYFLNANCLSTCPLTYFIQNSTNSCQKCISPCQTCLSASVSSCVSCLTGYLLFGSNCVLSCTNGYYSNNISCLSCSSPCVNCFSAGVCLSCESGKLLQGSWCVSNCSSGMIPINSTYCQICVSPCLTCISSNYSFCTSCNFGLFILGGLCYSICPSAYYPDSPSSSCKPCISPCNTCLSSTACLSCLDTSLFLINSTCLGCISPCQTCSINRDNCTSCDTSGTHPYLVNHFCLTNCPTGYFNQIFACVICSSPCQTCMNSSSSSCLTCLTGYLQLGNNCLLGCPVGYYSNNITCLICINNCSTCSSSTVCTSCLPGQYLLGSNCAINCPNGMITSNITGGGICQFCSSSCSTCLSSNTSYCTSCPNNVFLFGGQCLTNCSVGFFANNVSGSCSSCQLPCNTCTSFSSCLSCANVANFLINFSCVGCQYPCLTCSLSITNCTSCNTSDLNPYLYGSNCLSSCPPTYYNDASFTCLPCSSPCLSCFAAGSLSCLTCLANYFQLNNTCFLSCPLGYYQFVNQCIACTSPCLGCIAAGSCTSCIGGLFLLGSNCQANCSGMAVSGNFCIYCQSSCLTCLTSNNSYCTSCTTGLFLYSGVCHTNCTTGLYADGTSSSCLPCLAPCFACSTNNSCLSCLNTNQFLINSTCVSCSYPCLTCSLTVGNCTSCNTASLFPILFNYNCLSVCPLTYYNDTPTSCAKCSIPCDICSSAGTHSCLSCLPGYYLLGNNCYLTCPTTYFSNTTICSICISPCYACLNSPSICLSCQPTFYLRGSSCVSNCSTGQVLINGSICQICSGSCLTCLSSNYSYCTTCPSNSYQYQGTCISSCPAQYYANINSSRCDQCQLPCLTCSTITQCLSCALSTQFLINFVCVPCNSNCLSCTVTPTNCTACNTTSSLPYYFSNNCLASCPSTYYDGGSFNCPKCNIPCQTCTTSSNRSCITCLTGFSQLNSDCYVSCPTSYYSNGTHCLLCSNSTCLTCLGASTSCTSCQTSLFLLGSSCVANCSAGMIAGSGNICIFCSGSCKTCLTSNSSYCTSCYTSNFLYSGTCLITCPLYFFADSASGSCVSCQNPCKECLSLTSCISCVNPLHFIQNFACLSSCTYPLIGINHTCYQCSSQCLTCTLTVTTCLLCANGTYYFPATFACSLYCSFHILRFNMSNSGNNQCTQTCPISTYIDVNTVYCQACPSGCLSCLSMTSCSTCKSGFSYYSDFCYSICPPAAPYTINSHCIMCNISNCQTCQNTTYCATCTTNYLLIDHTNTSTCISNCPTGFIYDIDTLSCKANVNSNISSITNIVTSTVPSYTFLISSGCLLFSVFIIKFKYPSTNFSLSMFLCLTLTATASLAHLLYVQLKKSGLLQGSFDQLSVSACLLMSGVIVQAITCLGSVLSLIKIKDPQLLKLWKDSPFIFICILTASLFDSSLLFLTTSQLMNVSVFNLKFNTIEMHKLFKINLFSSMIVKLLNCVYSILQMSYFSTNAYRLLMNTANYPIDKPFTSQLLIISMICLLFIIYLLYNEYKDEKVQPDFKSDSHHSLIGDEGKIFDKRNQSNSQILLSLQNSDMIVDINSLKDQNQISFGKNDNLIFDDEDHQKVSMKSRQSRRYKGRKITPAQMLQKMQYQQSNKQQKSIQDHQQAEINNIDDVFFHQDAIDTQTEKQKLNDVNDSPQNADEIVDKQVDNNTIEAQNINVIQKKQGILNDSSKISNISDIQHQQNETQQHGQSRAIEKHLQQQLEAAQQKTKTEIINIISMDNNQHPIEKYSPSELSHYLPNQQIERQFNNSYLDDANKFNQHSDKVNEEIKQAEENKKNGIQFEVVNADFNQMESIQEISFQKRQDFLQNPFSPFSKVQQKSEQIQQKSQQQEQLRVEFQPQQPMMNSSLIRKIKQQEDIRDIMQDDYYDIPSKNTIRMEEDQQSYHQDSASKLKTPIQNAFFEQQEDQEQYKPSEGLNEGKNRRRRSKKPQIPLPKNQIEKEIMNIYRKKQITAQKKRRYPDIPNPNKAQSKNANYVQYSMQDKDFVEEGRQDRSIKKINYSGDFRIISRQGNFPSRASVTLQPDEDMPVKPSLQLRKSSFKKIGEMIVQGQSSHRQRTSSNQRK